MHNARYAHCLHESAEQKEPRSKLLVLVWRCVVEAVDGDIRVATRCGGGRAWSQIGGRVHGCALVLVSGNLESKMRNGVAMHIRLDDGELGGLRRGCGASTQALYAPVVTQARKKQPLFGYKRSTYIPSVSSFLRSMRLAKCPVGGWVAWVLRLCAVMIQPCERALPTGAEPSFQLASQFGRSCDRLSSTTRCSARAARSYTHHRRHKCGVSKITMAS